jgi:hypothetical protein
MTEETLEKLQEKKAELRIGMYGVHGGFHKGKFKMDIYRPDGRRKNIRTKPIHYFVPKTNKEKQAVQERIRIAKEKIRKREGMV